MSLSFDFRGLGVVFDGLTSVGNVGESAGLAREELWVFHSFVGDSRNRVYVTVN
jgi:hypothetical protein